MLHERHDGALGGRIGRVGWQESVNLVKDNERFEALGARQTPDPREDLFEQHTEYERPLFLVKMRHTNDDRLGSTVLWCNPICNVQACASAPAAEGW